MTARVLLRILTILRGTLYSAGFISLWVWLAASVRRSTQESPCRCGTGSCRSAARWLTTGRGTPAPFDPPLEFVASGPYRYVRNPMYVGAAMVLIGAGLALSSPAVVALGFVFLLLMHLLVVLYEEPALTARFGAPYERYRSTVPRWWLRRPRRVASGGA